MGGGQRRGQPRVQQANEPSRVTPVHLRQLLLLPLLNTPLLCPPAPILQRACSKSFFFALLQRLNLADALYVLGTGLVSRDRSMGRVMQ